MVDSDIRASIPVGRFDTPAEMASAVLYLASEEFRWVLGAEIIVDGVPHAERLNDERPSALTR